MNRTQMNRIRRRWADLERPYAEVTDRVGSFTAYCGHLYQFDADHVWQPVHARPLPEGQTAVTFAGVAAWLGISGISGILFLAVGVDLGVLPLLAGAAITLTGSGVLQRLRPTVRVPVKVYDRWKAEQLEMQLRLENAVLEGIER